MFIWDSGRMKNQGKKRAGATAVGRGRDKGKEGYLFHKEGYFHYMGARSGGRMA